MNPTLLLFDVDGTLLLTHGAGVRSMARAGRKVWGEHFSLDGIVVSGGLDPDLARQAARLEAAFDEAEHVRFQELYAAELKAELETCEPRPQALPGVLELLESARAKPGVTLGLLTGNYRATGELKLSSVGISRGWFSSTIWGDQAPTRAGLVARALAEHGRARPCDVLVIGDTPRDVECAQANGCRCLAVATGAYSVADLIRAGADLALEDLSDPEPLWQLVETA
jgi:phosphoglycolate phosphatase-like HAD superfamily hydrolase